LVVVASPVARHEAVFFVLYSQFVVRDADQVPGARPDLDVMTNGLVSRDAGWTYVHTRVDSGEVRVAAETYGSEPPPVLGGWEDVVEVLAPAPDGELMLDGVTIGAPEGYPSLSPAGPGDYRVRVHARGRDVPPWEAPDSVTEDYLVQVWPAAPGLPSLTVLKATSAYGAELREGE
jgi:hypothetical protein